MVGRVPHRMGAVVVVTIILSMWLCGRLELERQNYKFRRTGSRFEALGRRINGSATEEACPTCFHCGLFICVDI